MDASDSITTRFAIFLVFSPRLSLCVFSLEGCFDLDRLEAWQGLVPLALKCYRLDGGDGSGA